MGAPRRSTTFPHEFCYMSDPMDQFTNIRDAWDFIVYALTDENVRGYSWLKKRTVTEQSDFTLTVREDSTYTVRPCIVRHLMNPSATMMESCYFANERPMFIQWIALQEQPLRMEALRESLAELDGAQPDGAQEGKVMFDKMATEYFSETFQIILARATTFSSLDFSYETWPFPRVVPRGVSS